MVVPAEVRRHLGVGPGDKLRFVVGEDGRVELVTARLLTLALWAHNTGGAVDSTEIVRELRRQDQQVSQMSEADQAAGDFDPVDEDALTARLLESLGLPS